MSVLSLYHDPYTAEDEEEVVRITIGDALGMAPFHEAHEPFTVRVPLGRFPVNPTISLLAVLHYNLQEVARSLGLRLESMTGSLCTFSREEI